ncbi:MAG: hypothetical protein KF893_20430 [Caldilineaceae bacterium]|nr:hypothetical protein [Caldilineaceae bacterium]
MRARVRLLMLLGIALLCLGAWMPSPALYAQATGQGITLSAVPAFEGHFKYGEWLPIWVQVENSGNGIEAQVQARITSRNGVITYAAPASLPSGSRKRVPLYVPPNSFSHELDVQLVEIADRGGRNILLSQTVEIEPLPNITYLIGIVAPQRGALSLLNGVTLPGQKRPIALVDLPLADLPERVEGLRSFDLLILNDIDTSTLSPAQIRVLESWVHDGGRLVIGGGGAARATASGLPASLLPMTPRSAIDVDNLASLADFAAADPIRVPGPFVVARGDEITGQILAGDADLPLVVERRLGQGLVDIIALDLAVAPFQGWTGVTSFWEKLISPGAAYPEWMPADMAPARAQTEQMSYALSMLPSLDLPSVRSLAILLGVYIIVIGPVNYLLLRHWRRLHLAWITIPALTLLFSAGAFGIGYALRGNDLILNKIALITPNDDGPAEVLSFMGIFSPAQQSYDIEVDGDGLLSPTVRNADPWSMGGAGSSAAEMVIIQGTPGRLQGLAINQWSMQSFTAESRWSDFGRVEGNFEFTENALIGEIRNNTAYPLTDAVILWGNYFKRIGDLPAGATVPVQVEMATNASVMMGYSLGWRIYQAEMETTTGRFPRELEIKRNILDTLSQGMGGLQPMNAKMPAPLNLREVTVLAWLTEAPPAVRIAGETPSQQTTALLNVTFPPQWPASGELYLPPGILSGRLVELPQEGGQCGMGSTSVYIGRGEAIFDFTILPEFGDLTIDHLNVSLLTDGEWRVAPQIAVYDWDGERWLGLESPQIGINSLAFAPGMMDDSGQLRVRLSVDANQGGGCYYLEMGVEGQRRGAQS